MPSGSSSSDPSGCSSRVQSKAHCTRRWEAWVLDMPFHVTLAIHQTSASCHWRGLSISWSPPWHYGDQMNGGCKDLLTIEQPCINRRWSLPYVPFLGAVDSVHVVIFAMPSSLSTTSLALTLHPVRTTMAIHSSGYRYPA